MIIQSCLMIIILLGQHHLLLLTMKSISKDKQQLVQILVEQVESSFHVFLFILEHRNLFYTLKGAPRCFKRRVSANKKERRRTQSINTAFSDLRTAIPNVQPDTKLSKIKTLKLATKYIEFLMDILAKDDPTTMPSAFKAEIIKTRKDHRDLMKVSFSF